jgi:hypothetical protein
MAKTTMETLRKLKWNPSDFYLFARLKSDLQGLQFVDNDAAVQTVWERIHRQPQAFLKRASGWFQSIAKSV